MSFRSHRAILHAVPRREPRFSLRLKLVLAIVLCVVVGGSSAIAAYQLRESNEPTEMENERAEVVMQYLAANHADAPWYGYILDVTIKDQRLYVRTSLEATASSSNADDEVQRSIEATWTRRIYQVLWDWHFEVPELDFYYVYIQDKDGYVIDGGQA